MRRLAYRVALFCAFVLPLASCPQPVKLPADPGLLAEDFGIGISLLLPAAEARELTASNPGKYQIEAVSRDEFSGRAPYDSAMNTTDRVLAIYQASALDNQSPNNLVPQEAVTEIRCYLADPANSFVQLRGEPAAKLTEARAQELFGEPVQRTETGEGEVHFTYYFAQANNSQEMLQLVLSFHSGGYCFALALALQPRVK